MLRSAPPVLALCCFAALLATPARAAQDPQQEAAFDELAKLPKKDVEAAAQRLLAAVDALALQGHEACRALAQSTAAKATAHAKAFPTREAGKGAPPPPREAPPFPLAVRYAFGTGRIEPVPAANSGRHDAAKEHAEHALHLALLGLRPDADRMLAALLRDLDGDRGADRFAAFLESWRNGDESFYQALDRTAGTKDSVFFYDAMLQDFTAAFAKGKDGKAALGSLQAAHDSLHDGFLAYRQYRAFREAVAWSLVLPPDLPLPEPLRRYEALVEGAYSLRQQVAMLLELHDGDPGEVVRLANRRADPLAEPLWAKPYDPYAKWSAVFAEAVPRMVERSGSTDAFATTVRERSAAAARSLREAALAALGPTKGAH